MQCDAQCPWQWSRVCVAQKRSLHMHTRPNVRGRRGMSLSNNKGRESCEILFPRTLYLLLSFSRWYQKAYWQHWIVFTMTLCDQFACMLSIRLCIRGGASNNHQKQGNHCNHNLQPLSTKFGKKPKRRFLYIQLLYLSRRLGWGRPAGEFLGTSGSHRHLFALSHFSLIFTCLY